MKGDPYTQSRSNLVIYLLRIAIFILVLSSIFHIFAPNLLALISELLPLNSSLAMFVVDQPGFNDEWRSILNLITLHGYVYFIVIIILIYYLIFQDSNQVSSNNSKPLHPVIARIFSPNLLLTQSKKNVNDNNANWITSKRIGAVMFDVGIIIALSYFGYESLSGSAKTSGTLTKIIDSIFVSYWCYCIFSVVFFILFSILQSVRLRKF